MQHEGFLALGHQGRHLETGLGKNHARKWRVCSGWGARAQFCSCMSGSMATHSHLQKQLRLSSIWMRRGAAATKVAPSRVWALPSLTFLPVQAFTAYKV